ncbi:condensation domain-containing protein [Streptomyces sp. C8S0]|uniref:condensation domain-containing protein n=1 Tax=Streptomyces sp. C8S0 TaxID=2585716 RepID=UPI001867C8BF|nr:condensation domain-containing protein [Streptomyces sp. C8S0]
MGALSSGQERLWFFEQLHRRKAPNLLILSLDLYGPLEEGALRHALAAVVARHEPLRTVFGQERGIPKATLWPEAEFPWKRVPRTDSRSPPVPPNHRWPRPGWSGSPTITTCSRSRCTI